MRWISTRTEPGNKGCDRMNSLSSLTELHKANKKHHRPCSEGEFVELQNELPDPRHQEEQVVAAK